MDQKLLEELKTVIRGDVATDAETIAQYSHDASLFEIPSKAVVFPRDSADVEALVKFVNDRRKDDPSLSLTGRSAGTDMSGGSVNDSILVAFGKYFTRIKSIAGNVATVEPGVFYRDFEKEALKQNLIFPSYPASRELCAIGGIVNNNSGGEKSLQYGKTEKYVKQVKIVLSDGNEYVIAPLNEDGLKQKLSLQTFEGEIYRSMHKLLTENYDELKAAKPQVSKNSAGYYLWNVYDKKKGIFDLTQIIVGAQGTLGLVTEASIGLVPVKKHAEMMTIFLHDLNHLGQIINTVLPLQPETFEAYDDNTLKLALKFFPAFAKQLGTKNIIATGIDFLPEFLMVLTSGLPKMVLQIDFKSDDPKELEDKIAMLREKLKPLHPQTRIAREKEETKYWLIRRESFNLLRQKIHNLHTAPFIDDFAIKPEYLSEFFPKINAIFSKYPKLIYTVAGHVGDGNFHIIPLMKIEDPEQRAVIPKLGKEIYDLVLRYHGTITAEHNDGLIRAPYLKQMYGEKVYSLFEQTKKIFDPNDIFNPRKKLGADMDYVMNHIRMQW